MKLTETDVTEPLVCPDSSYPLCSSRPAVGRDEGQQGFRDLDVEHGFADPTDAPTMSPGRWRQHDCHRSPSAKSASFDWKKLAQRRDDVVSAQSMSVCLCVAVFWLGAVMVPVYTFWYLSYVRDVSSAPLLQETVDRDIVDLALFTRVWNASDPPLLARRGRSDLSSQPATAAPTDSVDRTRRSPAASDRGYAVSRRISTKARTPGRPRTTSSRRRVSVARRFTATARTFSRSRATSHWSFSSTRGFTVPGASPWDSFITQPVTAVSETKLPSLAVSVSSRRNSLGPMAADATTTTPIRWPLPVNDGRDVAAKRPDAKGATTQPSEASSSLASQRDTRDTRLPESPAAKTVAGLDSWTSVSFPETTGASFWTRTPFTETTETSSWTKMAFHESTASTPAVESRGLDRAHTVDSATTGIMATRTVIDGSPHAHETELEDSTSAVGLNELTFTEGPTEKESAGTVHPAVVGRDGTVSDGASSTEVPYVAFGGRQRKGAMPGGTTDERSHWEFEYGEDGDNDEALSARLKDQKTAIVRDSRRSAEQAVTGRKIWKKRFTATMRRNTV
ncbi:uncharacterized protein LOC142584902 isoform X2 [Dermacentor variabilis]|uniref:uncharacterized protein LOC142584902 isoform X2 n=1 Tax=Dermacentor variabilis TaxID=34621 RepID=UPI003F5C45A3